MSLNILAIDPGSSLSGYVIYSCEKKEVLEFGKITNEKILKFKTDEFLVIIEKPDYISAGAGETVIETIFWAGRFYQHFKFSTLYGRKEVQRKFSVKNDAAVIKLIKKEYPGIKLAKDSWQAMLLIHAYNS